MMDKRQQSQLFISLDDLVSEGHSYRKLDAQLSFETLSKPYLNLYWHKGRKEKGVAFGLRCLVLQFIEDISDREMERFLQEFCPDRGELKGNGVNTRSLYLCRYQPTDQ